MSISHPSSYSTNYCHMDTLQHLLAGFLLQTSIVGSAQMKDGGAQNEPQAMPGKTVSNHPTLQ